MDKKKQKAILESILFAMGDSVELSKLAAVLELTEKQTKEILLEMQKEYKKGDRGIMLTELEDAWQLCTKPEMYEHLIQVVKAPRKYTLTDSLLETLSIVAYKQPVTKSEIDKIRGVSCEHAVNRLLDFELITEVGRKDAPGKPILLGTTENFLRSFGVNSITDLPELNPDTYAQFKEEAESEIPIKMEI